MRDTIRMPQLLLEYGTFSLPATIVVAASKGLHLRQHSLSLIETNNEGGQRGKEKWESVIVSSISSISCDSNNLFLP